MAGGKSPKNKGNRTERAIARYLQSQGVAAARVPLSGSVGASFAGDLRIRVLGADRSAEIKCRGRGFGQLYSWLADHDLLIVRADRAEPLIIARLSFAAEVLAAAERGT